jgi:hypothetical protein
MYSEKQMIGGVPQTSWGEPNDEIISRKQAEIINGSKPCTHKHPDGREAWDWSRSCDEVGQLKQYCEICGGEK